MWKKIDQYVKQHHMIEKGDRILVGLSGGADSMLLSRYLLHLRDQEGIEIIAVHVNHLLRGEEAMRDENFVRAFCRRWDIPCFIFRREVEVYAKEHRMGFEEAGRELRYACFEEIMEKEGCDKIAVAHHANDLAETMIFRMIRGTGPEGLSGMQPKAGRRIRPLLCVDKREILGILQLLEEDFVDDSTNAETDYSRNYIRHEILPAMSSVNERVIDHMSCLSEQLFEQTAFINRQMERLMEEQVFSKEDGVSINLSFLKECGSFEQKEIIRRMIFLAGGHRKNISAIHVDMVQGLLSKEDRKQCDLPYNLIAMKEKDSLSIKKRKDSDSFVIKRMEIPIDSKILEEEGKLVVKVDDGRFIHFVLEEIDYQNLEQFVKNNCVKCFDYDKINSTLCLRTRKSGDYFIMDHSGKHKKLKRYFIDRKVPEPQRDKMLLLAKEEHILWIEDGRISEHFKVDGATKRVLKLYFNDNM